MLHVMNPLLVNGIQATHTPGINSLRLLLTRAPFNANEPLLLGDSNTDTLRQVEELPGAFTPLTLNLDVLSESRTSVRYM